MISMTELRKAIAGRARRTGRLASAERRQRAAHEWREGRTEYWLGRYNRCGDGASLRMYRQSRALGRKSRRTLMAMHRKTEASRAKLRYWRRLLRRRQSEFQPWMLNGKPGNITPAVKKCVVRAVNAGLYVTSTTGGQHAANSYHYAGRAVDVAGPWDKMVAFQRDECAERASEYLELFGPDNAFQVKNGQRFAFSEGHELEEMHDSHFHGALQ